MKEKEIKKKTLTISTPTKKSFDPSKLATSGHKKSFIVEKKFYRKRTDKNFISSKPKQDSNKINNQTNIGKKKDFFNNRNISKTNFEIRKIAEQRATNRFKDSKQDKDGKTWYKDACCKTCGGGTGESIRRNY